jgi:RND superfamily putative drug exporter
VSRLDRLARAVLQRRRGVLISILLATIGAGAVALSSVGHFANGGFGVAVSDSARTVTLLQKDFGGSQDFVLVVRTRDGSDVASAAQTEFGLKVQNDLMHQKAAASVASWWTTRDPTMVSRDHTSALVVASLHGDAAAAKTLAARYSAMPGPAQVIPGGPLVIENELGSHIAHDLLIIEAVAVPLTLLLLVVVFRSLAAA